MNRYHMHVHLMDDTAPRRIYEGNTLRFFGISSEEVTHGRVSMDGSGQ